MALVVIVRLSNPRKKYEASYSHCFLTSEEAINKKKTFNYILLAAHTYIQRTIRIGLHKSGIHIIRTHATM